MKVMCCIASGPSLTREDCEKVREAGIETIAVNNAWKFAPFSKYLFGGDYNWWKVYKDEIECKAERWTCSMNAKRKFNINYFKKRGPYNSGMRAIELAMAKGANSIILLGYDGSLKNGVHFDGKHSGGYLAKNGNYVELRNPNEKSVANWQKEFARVAEQAEKNNVQIINCTKETALTQFKTGKLEDTLRWVGSSRRWDAWTW